MSWQAAKAADGRTYYFHSQTQETTWDKPADFEDASATPASSDVDADPANWATATSPDGRTYYYNKQTQKTTWDKPSALDQTPSAMVAAPTFVAGAGNRYGGRQNSGGVHHRAERSEDHGGHGLPMKPAFDGPRGGSGGGPWESHTGYRGAAAKLDEPEFGTYEAAEEAFFKVLEKAGVTAESEWRQSLRLVVGERDFRAIKDPKDRKEAFEKFRATARAQEKEREKERKEKQRANFRDMLQMRDDVQHDSHWTLVRPLIEHEATFQNVDDEGVRKRIFEDYVLESKKQHAVNSQARRSRAFHDLSSLLQALVTKPNAQTDDAWKTLTTNQRFVSDDIFTVLDQVDIIQVFQAHMQALWTVEQDEIQKQHQARARHARKAREAYSEIIRELLNAGEIKPWTLWTQIWPKIRDDPRVDAYVGLIKSHAIDHFRDAIVAEEEQVRTKRHLVLEVLKEAQYEMTVDTTAQEFAKVMHSHPKTAEVFADETELKYVFGQLLDRVRARGVEADTERQQDAIDDLRHQIKKLDPPVRIDDSFKDVMQRLKGHRYYENANDDARRAAYEKFMRRLQEKGDDYNRNRPRRDHRDHPSSSRRDRPLRPRSEEVDAYKDDRMKAQADRERHRRKPSFGLSPPPRDRRDDRFGDRRHDGASVYDRERREREMERERNFTGSGPRPLIRDTRDSRDPRDRGKTLDYGDDDVGSSRSGSVRKRRDSEGSLGSRREVKRSRHHRSVEADSVLKEEEPVLQSGSEEGEIEEV